MLHMHICVKMEKERDEQGNYNMSNDYEMFWLQRLTALSKMYKKWPASKLMP